MKNKEFPKDFLWGASTSAFQVEGGFNEERGIANSDMRHIPDGLADYKQPGSLSPCQRRCTVDERTWYEGIPLFILLDKNYARW